MLWTDCPMNFGLFLNVSHNLISVDEFVIHKYWRNSLCKGTSVSEFFQDCLVFFKLPSTFPGPTLFIYIMKICFMTINSNKGLWTYELQLKIFEEIENKNAPLLVVKSSEHLASDVFVNMAVNHCKRRAVSFNRSHQVYLGTKQLVCIPRKRSGHPKFLQEKWVELQHST